MFVNKEASKDKVSSCGNLHVSLNDNCIFSQIKRFYLENKNELKIGHINVNSIRHKFLPFKEILEENVFDVLAIQETKLDEYSQCAPIFCFKI